MASLPPELFWLKFLQVALINDIIKQNVDPDDFAVVFEISFSDSRMPFQPIIALVMFKAVILELVRVLSEDCS